MSLQFMIVSLIVVAATIYFGLTVYKKSRTFSPNEDCGDDCGCGSGSKSTK